MSENAANLIADEGSAFGARCARLISGMERASMQGGNAFRAKVEDDLFEELLERSLEVMRSHSSHEACDLFEACAKTEFYGALAPKQDVKSWSDVRWSAWQAIAHPENVEAA